MHVNVFNYIVEYVKLLLFLCGILNFRYRNTLTAKGGVLLGLIVTAIAGSLCRQEYSVVFSAIVIPIVCLAVEGKLRLPFATLGFLFICCLDDGLAAFLKWCFRISDDALENNPYVFSAFNAASLIILTVISLFLHHFYYTKRTHGMPARNYSSLYIVLLVIGQASTLVFIAPFTLTDYHPSMRNNILVTISACTLSILFLITGLLLTYYNNSRNYYRRMSKFRQEFSRAQQNYYQTLLEKEHETRKFRHDISNHLLCVNSLIKEQHYEEAEQYIAQMNGSINELRPGLQTGNMPANVILNDMIRKYETVTADWTGHIPEQLLVSDMDICIILSNLLENAFHAAAQCDGNRIVAVSVKILGNMLSITVRNPMNTLPKKSKGTLLTQKSDKVNHGYGILNVKDAVERNKGIVRFSYSDMEFLAEVLLPDAFEMTVHTVSQSENR